MDPAKDETVEIKPAAQPGGSGVSPDDPDAETAELPPSQLALKDSRPHGSSRFNAANDKASVVAMAELLLMGMNDSGADLVEDPGSGKPRRTWIGRLIGDYRVEEELGRGGMGIVFRARNVRVGSTVALKLLRFAPGESAERLRRFETEARAAAALNHPNIINVFDVGQVGDLYYLAMEYVQGKPLSDKLKEGPLDPQQAVRITMDVCNALEFAHEAGVVHRDIKPSNILLEPSGRAQIMDFGLARTIFDENPRKLTEDGSILGTVHYMSPEQAQGQSHLADSRSDVYAIGAVLYEMLTGIVPFDGKTPLEVVKKVAEEEPVRPRKRRFSLDRDIEIIVLKAMEKDPMRRYRSAAALRDDLWKYLNGEPIQARPPSRLYRASKFLIKHRAYTIPIGLAIAAGIGALIFLKLHDKKMISRFESTHEEALRVRVMELEAGDLRQPSRERWRLIHALRLKGRLDEAVQELELLKPEDPGGEDEKRLWRAILRREAGQDGFAESLSALRAEAPASRPAWLAQALAGYLDAAPSDPLACEEPARTKLAYHLAVAARLRGDHAARRSMLNLTAQGPPELIEACCAKVELDLLDAAPQE